MLYKENKVSPVGPVSRTAPSPCQAATISVRMNHSLSEIARYNAFAWLTYGLERCSWGGVAHHSGTSAVDLLLCIHDVEEAVLLILVLLVNIWEHGIMLHQVLSGSEHHHALVLISAKLQLLPDDGQDLTDLEGVGHQESIPSLS